MELEFQLEETLRFRHSVNVKIDQNQKEEFYNFVEQIAEELEERGQDYDQCMIVQKFVEQFGKEKVTFCQDTSPDVSYEGL